MLNSIIILTPVGGVSAQCSDELIGYHHRIPNLVEILTSLYIAKTKLIFVGMGKSKINLLYVSNQTGAQHA